MWWWKGRRHNNVANGSSVSLTDWCHHLAFSTSDPSHPPHQTSQRFFWQTVGKFTPRSPVPGYWAKCWLTFTLAVSRRSSCPLSSARASDFCSSHHRLLISPSVQRPIDFWAWAETHSTSVSPLMALPPVAFRCRQRMMNRWTILKTDKREERKWWH